MIVLSLCEVQARRVHNPCFLNEPCPEGKVCSNYKMLHRYQLRKRLAILEREYRRPWSVKSETLHWASRFNKSVRKKYKDINLKDIYKETVVLNYKIGKKEKEMTFYVYDKVEAPSNVQRRVKRKEKPLLIVIPPIYDISPFDYWQAYEYADRGYKVAILDLGGISYVSPFNHTKSIDRATLKTLGDVQRLIDYMVLKSNVDRKRIGIFGFSLGGNIASLAFSVNPRIKALSTVSSAGKFAELLTNSKQAVASLYRYMRKRKEGYDTNRDYLNALKKSFLFDPVYFAHLRNPDDVYLVFSGNDSAVPTKNQRELESAFCASESRGNSRWESGEHFPVIVKDLFKRAHIDKFFDKKLLR